jgi:replicative DNA helicase
MENNRFSDVASEVEVLGAVFIDNDIFKDIVDILSPEDFYNTNHSMIFDIMKKLYLESKPIDIRTVVNELGSNLSAAGGITYLSELAASSFTSMNAAAHALIVKQKSDRRKLFNLFNKYLNNVKNTDVKNEELIDKLQNDFRSMEYSDSRRDGSLNEVMEKFMNLLEKRYQNQGILEGYATGFKSLDKFTGGFQKQDMIILAGRPSMGKSAVALNMALNMSVDMGHKVAVFHLEMSKLAVIQRIISSSTLIPMNNLKKGELGDEDWVKLSEKCNQLAATGLYIYDEVYSLAEIRSECKRLKLQKGLDVVFIDYLQLIQNESRKENRNENIGEISRGLKLLAKELDITVVALSQLSRALEVRANHRPQLSDLRDSGSLEQDADMVVFLYRDEYYNRDTEDPGIIEFIIAKHRNGETGTIKAKWQGKYQKVVA